jgi:ABC-type lipoprotein release transport system permease subunit
MALGVGALVGFALRIGNGGKAFGVLGAFLALFGCILGNYLSLIAFASAEEHVAIFTMLNNADVSKVINAMWDDFISGSFLFYAMAAYEGYKFSAFRSSNVFSASDRASQQKPAEVVRADQVDAQVRC